LDVFIVDTIGAGFGGFVLPTVGSCFQRWEILEGVGGDDVGKKLRDEEIE
jgi:hypothetical protein